MGFKRPEVRIFSPRRNGFSQESPFFRACRGAGGIPPRGLADGRQRGAGDVGGREGVADIGIDIRVIFGYIIGEGCTSVRFGRYGRGFCICCGGKVLFFIPAYIV